MDIKSVYKIGLFSIVFVVLAAQAAPKTKKQLMDEALQERVDTYIETALTKCENKVQKRAAEIVDSLLVSEAQVKTIDTFKRPIKPTKPQRPAVRNAKDTSAVKPLFDQ